MVAKHCSKCREKKPLHRFRKRKASADGHAYECDDCRSARRRHRYQVDEDYRRNLLDKQRAANAANPERNRAKVHAWRASNPDRVKAARVYHRRKDLEGYNAYQREWRKTHTGTANAATARRHASKMLAMPAWAERQKIAVLYKKAAEWAMHVDHVVPLRGALVCGLHVHANLQLLAPAENIAKRNYRWPDMPTDPA